MSNEQLIQQILSLPLSERIDLAQTLWENIHEGLDFPETEEDQDVIEEARKRGDELMSGAVTGHSHEQVMESARRVLGCD
jgi:putative addiction module component (TIGR02574 family)